MDFNNLLAQAICRTHKGASYLDCKNILWKFSDKWIGKRSVWTFDNRAVWLSDTTIENIKTWLCGKEEDHNEKFGLKEADNKVNS